MLYRVDEILGYLNRCERTTSNRADPLELLAKRLSLRGLIVSFIFLLLMLLPLGIYAFFPEKLFILVSKFFFILMMLSGIFTLLVEPALMLLGLFKWKTMTLTRFLKEVQEDEGHAALSRYEENELQYAEFQLIKKITANENRVKVFFGEKTAVFALLAFSVPFMKELFGWNVNFSVFLWGDDFSGYTDTLLGFVWALIFGMSLGAIALKLATERYKYQLSLLKQMLWIRTL
ncbi:hypothetical protein CTZ44_10380 [Salmonella enterica]|nr:hypothetical protein [Salmonella enterica]EDV3120970.1 hypothetical protein [Salmonella enterica subsp. enterica]EGX0281993.1 hypothetical protein [Salmonella enterica]